jgi:oligosaccharide repeat unit polymerase
VGIDLVYLFLALAVFWSLLFSARLRLSFIHIMASILTLNCVGLYMLGKEGGQSAPLVMLGAGLVMFATGVLAGRAAHAKSSRQESELVYASVIQQRNAAVVILIVGVPILVASLMLYVLNGIPLLSAEANELRFTVNEGAGVFWRMQQFGLPMITLIAGVYMMGARMPLTRIKLLFFTFFAATLITSLMRGHKAALAYAFLWVIVMMLVMNRKRVLPKKWIAYFIIILLASFGVMVPVTQWLLQMNTEEALYLLGARATSIEAEGFYNVVQSYVPVYGLQYGLAQWPSFLGFLATLRLWPRDLGTQADLNQVIAHHVYGVPLSSTEFVFPMSLSPFSDLYLDFGLPGILVGGLLLGIFAEWLYRRTAQLPPSLHKAFLIALQVEMIFYASRGALIGRISNEVINLIVVIVAYFATRYLLYRFASRPVTPTGYPPVSVRAGR